MDSVRPVVPTGVLIPEIQVNGSFELLSGLGPWDPAEPFGMCMDDSTFEVERKLVRSIIGNGSKILSSSGMIPKWERFIVGKNTALNLLFRNHGQAPYSHGRNQINEASSD
jgi:hypothetical protein